LRVVTPSSTTSSAASVPIGKEVVLHVGEQELRAVVVEDRGPIGVNGERVVRIRVSPAVEGEEPDEFEVRVSALTW
jgi:hypothetical protein